jgi:hypothetical protein
MISFRQGLIVPDQTSVTSLLRAVTVSLCCVVRSDTRIAQAAGETALNHMVKLLVRFIMA